MKIKQLYDDFHINYVMENDEHRHARPGWVNTECVFCAGDNPGYHLGYNLDDNYFYCWRCGHHQTKKTLTKLLSVEYDTVSDIIKRYTGGVKKAIRHKDKNAPASKQFSLPTGCGPMLRSHEQYLLSRRFDPDKLRKIWGLLGTGPVSNLDGADYKLRIIAPIKWDGRIVSFQGRDITDRHPHKYKTCSKERETIHHKKILYGLQSYWKQTGIIVEGITDVWRFGPIASATFGIKFSTTQARIIAKSFKRIFIIYDPEPQAQQQARRLQREVKGFAKNPNVIVYNIIDIDPGSMDQTEANYLIKQLLR